MIFKNQKSIGGVLLCLFLLASFWEINLSPNFNKKIFASQTTNHVTDIKTEVICSALQNSLNESPVVFNFHLQIPRDQNDYTVFTLDEQTGNYSFVVNEQRQIVFYVNKQNRGYELTDLGSEFYREIAQRQKNIDGSSINDLIDVGIVFETLDKKGEKIIQISAYGGAPSPSTIKIDVPRNVISTSACKYQGRMGVELPGSEVGLEITVIDPSTTMRTIALRRSSVALMALSFLIFNILFMRIKLRNVENLASDE
jgi:hypothetical protein